MYVLVSMGLTRETVLYGLTYILFNGMLAMKYNATYALMKKKKKIVFVLRGQLIKLIQVVSTSELHDN